jgi:hypothetical protein
MNHSSSLANQSIDGMRLSEASIEALDVLCALNRLDAGLTEL